MTGDALPEQATSLPQGADKIGRLEAVLDRLIARGVSPDVAATTALAIISKDPTPLLTEEEFATLIHREPETVKKWVAQNKLPAVRIRGDRHGQRTLGIHWDTAIKALSTPATNK